MARYWTGSFSPGARSRACSSFRSPGHIVRPEQSETGNQEDRCGRLGIESKGGLCRLDGLPRLPGIGQHRGKGGMRLGVAGPERDRQAGRSDRCLVLAVHGLGFGEHRTRSR